MKFQDIYVSKEKRFSIGIEKSSGKYYISIPVSNSYVDYEEYYEISKDIVDQYPKNIDKINKLVSEYRQRKRDDELIIKPGKNRGTAL